MLIDTHAHVNFSSYKEDADEVIRRSLDSDIWMINVGSQYATSKRAVELAGKYNGGVYASVGLHPIYAKDGFDYDKYKQLIQLPVVKAVGEIGLDYKKEYAFFKEKQKEIFLEQIRLAEDFHLPIIFHCRMAHEDLIKILGEQIGRFKGVVHCFTGNWSQAEKYLKMGFSLGFNGIIFKFNLDDIIKKTPLDKILLETDCPYLTPPPKQGRNEPLYLRYVAEKIASLKKISLEKTVEVTTENAIKLFGL